MKKIEEEEENSVNILYQHEVKPILLIMITCDHDAKEEELRSHEEAGVNRVFICKTTLVTPYGNGVGCRTTSPFARSRHYISSR